jgi:hypothetical protein
MLSNLCLFVSTCSMCCICISLTSFLNMYITSNTRTRARTHTHTHTHTHTMILHTLYFIRAAGRMRHDSLACFHRRSQALGRARLAHLSADQDRQQSSLDPNRGHFDRRVPAQDAQCALVHARHLRVALHRVGAVLSRRSLSVHESGHGTRTRLVLWAL